MKHSRLFILLTPVAIALGTGATGAATVSYFNGTAGAEVTEWRTSTTAKTLDLDGDNFYGTFAAVQWTVAGINQRDAGSTTPGWAYLGTGDQYGGYPTQVDNAGGGADVGTSIAVNGFAFEMTGVAATYAGMTVRVGVMQDMLRSDEWAADQFKGLRLFQTGGGSGDSGVISVRSGGSGDGMPEMLFFDLTNVNPGDRFQIQALNDQGGTPTQAGYLGPVSWDVVPEPSATLLAGLTGLGMMLRRRR